MPAPFLVLATQNPLEQEGTYPLPEAQVDRFMFKVILNYPNRAEELMILDRMGSVSHHIEVQPILEPDDISSLRESVDKIYVDEKIKNYIVDSDSTPCAGPRSWLGINGSDRIRSSPRATIALVRAGRANAFLEGRGFVTPHDIKITAPDVSRHRILVSYEAEAEELRSEVADRLYGTAAGAVNEFGDEEI